MVQSGPNVADCARGAWTGGVQARVISYIGSVIKLPRKSANGGHTLIERTVCWVAPNAGSRPRGGQKLGSESTTGAGIELELGVEKKPIRARSRECVEGGDCSIGGRCVGVRVRVLCGGRRESSEGHKHDLRHNSLLRRAGPATSLQVARLCRELGRQHSRLVESHVLERSRHSL